MNKLKLEVGKAYRTRSGEKVEITGFRENGNYYPFISIDDNMVRHTYKIDGRTLARRESDNDIISEWEEEPTPGTDDKINHPSHYTTGKVECIDAIESATTGLTGIEAVCTANAIKYLWRWKQKNGVEDLKKAQWYINNLIEKL